MERKHTTGKDSAYVRRANSSAVVQALRTKGQMGRRELSELTGLSFATVCRVVDELIERSLLLEAASVSLGNAKRRTALLDINPSGGWVVAVDVGGSQIRASALDLAGNIHKTVDLALDSVQGEESVTPALLSVLRKLISAWGRGHGAPKVVGVSCSGIADSASGVVKLSFNLQLRDYPIARIVQDAFGIPTVACNDVHASTLAEATLGPGREHPDFAYITIGTGIGAGLVLSGKPTELPEHAEFGLMVVAPEGDPERLGGRGYLEALASGRGIAAAARRELASGAESVLSTMVSGDFAKITAKHVAEAAAIGDNLAAGVMTRAASYLGIGIVNLAHCLGLTYFVIGGQVATSGDVFWKPLRESVREHEFWPGRTVLVPSSLRKDAALIGAGALALDQALGIE